MMGFEGSGKFASPVGSVRSSKSVSMVPPRGSGWSPVGKGIPVSPTPGSVPSRPALPDFESESCPVRPLRTGPHPDPALPRIPRMVHHDALPMIHCQVRKHGGSLASPAPMPRAQFRSNRTHPSDVYIKRETVRAMSPRPLPKVLQEQSVTPKPPESAKSDGIWRDRNAILADIRLDWTRAECGFIGACRHGRRHRCGIGPYRID